jgi:hypothetical protein
MRRMSPARVDVQQPSEQDPVAGSLLGTWVAVSNCLGSCLLPRNALLQAFLERPNACCLSVGQLWNRRPTGGMSGWATSGFSISGQSSSFYLRIVLRWESPAVPEATAGHWALGARRRSVGDLDIPTTPVETWGAAGRRTRGNGWMPVSRREKAA